MKHCLLFVFILYFRKNTIDKCMKYLLNFLVNLSLISTLWDGDYDQWLHHPMSAVLRPVVALLLAVAVPIAEVVKV